MDSQRFLFASGLLLVATAAAGAAPSIVTYRFGDLSGDFTLFDGQNRASLGGHLVISAVASDTHTSSGDISRIDDKPGTGEFDPGFAQSPPFSVLLDIDVTNISAAGALGTGFLTITDADGDTLTADITGAFGFNSGFLFYNAVSGDYTFNAPDGWFNGTSGAIEIDDLVGTLFDGSLSLLIDAPGGLTQNFADSTASLDGNLVPTPAALAAIAGIGLLPRRRHREHDA